MANNKIIYILVAVIFLLVGYLFGNFFPFKGPLPDSNQTGGNQTSDQGNNNNKPASIPAGKGLLEVTVKNSSNEPLIGIEVDVAAQPGQPQDWGIKEADVNGQVNYELAPGTYYVFFNLNRFPVGYRVIPEQRVEIKEGQTTKTAIVLEKS